MKSLLARLEKLEQKMLPNPSRVLLDLFCAASDGDEAARLQLIDLCANFQGRGHLDEVVAASGLLEGPFDPADLLDESDAFVFESEGEKNANETLAG
ncbi:MAG TPA: hypothetical protein VMH80_03445 [Bryobacteraceae bacterium]|nr:hypothetical protein [Bryobacteraceae bacterium]